MTEAEGAKPAIPVQDVEQLVRSIQGISDCRIVINDWGGIEECHVLATSERSPRILVRDVESALHARFGLSVDHKKISIAQLSNPNGGADSSFRLRIKSHSLQVSQIDQQVSVRVELVTPGGEVLEGESKGASEARAGARLAASATIAAINRMTKAPRNFVLVEVALSEAGGRRLVTAVVELSDGRSMPEVLVGAALLRSDEVHAAIKATLDAVNRRLAVKGDASGI